MQKIDKRIINLLNIYGIETLFKTKRGYTQMATDNTLIMNIPSIDFKYDCIDLNTLTERHDSQDFNLEKFFNDFSKSRENEYCLTLNPKDILTLKRIVTGLTSIKRGLSDNFNKTSSLKFQIKPTNELNLFFKIDPNLDNFQAEFKNMDFTVIGDNKDPMQVGFNLQTLCNILKLSPLLQNMSFRLVEDGIIILYLGFDMQKAGIIGMEFCIAPCIQWDD